jgi:hypothetical protein
LACIVFFFLSQEARMLVLKEEKRRRREERKARKAEERKTGQKQPKLQGSGAKLNWREAAKKNVGDDIVFENRCARALEAVRVVAVYFRRANLFFI